MTAETDKSALTIEQAFLELDKLMEEMEQPGCSLEDSFKDYQKGLEYLKFCNEKIDGIEKQIRILDGREGESVQ